MFGFIKKCFFTAITFYNYNTLNVNSLECISMNNQECKTRSEIIYVNIKEPMFYLYSITINKCNGSCILVMTHMLNYVLLIPLKR